MKKILSCVLTIILGLTLAGCLGSGEKLTAEEFDKQMEECIKNTSKQKNLTINNVQDKNTKVSGTITYADNFKTKIKNTSSSIYSTFTEYTETSRHYTEKEETKDLIKNGDYSSESSDILYYESYYEEDEDNSYNYYYRSSGATNTALKDALSLQARSVAGWACVGKKKEASISNDELLEISYLEYVADHSIFTKSGNTYTADCSDQSKFGYLNTVTNEMELRIPYYSNLYLGSYGTMKHIIEKYVIKLDSDGLLSKIEIEVSLKGEIDAKNYLTNLYPTDEQVELKENVNSIKATGTIAVDNTYHHVISLSKYGSTAVSIPENISALKNNITIE